METVIANVAIRTQITDGALVDRHRGFRLERRGGSYADLTALGRRFGYSHSQRVVGDSGEPEDWLVFEDIGPFVEPVEFDMRLRTGHMVAS